jgi:hypothetical protein
MSLLKNLPTKAGIPGAFEAITGHRVSPARLQRNDEPQDQVGHQARQPAGQEQDDKQQPEPKRTEPKEVGQAAADAGDDAVAARTP